MKYLLSNDDGVYAPGLNTLAEYLREAGHEVNIIAPDRDRSGASNSLTLDRPLHPVTLENGSVSLNGTPTDCVHLGLNAAVFGDEVESFDRVISGINDNANLGDDVIYSGTVAAAMEGRSLKKAPIAVSLIGKTHFLTAAKVVSELLPVFDSLTLPPRTLISINIPDLPYHDLKGIEVTRLGHREVSDNPVVMQNPRGKKCYWIAAAGNGADAGPGTDFHAVSEGRVSITPVNVDMTHSDLLAELSDAIAAGWPGRG